MGWATVLAWALTFAGQSPAADPAPSPASAPAPGIARGHQLAAVVATAPAPSDRLEGDDGDSSRQARRRRHCALLFEEEDDDDDAGHPLPWRPVEAALAVTAAHLHATAPPPSRPRYAGRTTILRC